MVQREEGETVFSGTLGADRRFDVFQRDFYVVVEYPRNGFGTASPEEYTDVFNLNDPSSLLTNRTAG